MFTWYGATLELDGATETDYTADEVGIPKLFFFRPPGFLFNIATFRASAASLSNEKHCPSFGFADSYG